MSDVNFSIPNWCLNQKVNVVFDSNVDDTEGQIKSFSDHHIVIETEDFTELIPWTSIAEIYIDTPTTPRKQQVLPTSRRVRK